MKFGQDSAQNLDKNYKKVIKFYSDSTINEVERFRLARREISHNKYMRRIGFYIGVRGEASISSSTQMRRQ